MFEETQRLARAVRRSADTFRYFPERWRKGIFDDGVGRCAMGEITFQYFGKGYRQLMGSPDEAAAAALNRELEVIVALRETDDAGYPVFGTIVAFNDSRTHAAPVVVMLDDLADYLDELAAWQAECEGFTPMQPIEIVPRERALVTVK